MTTETLQEARRSGAILLFAVVGATAAVGLVAAVVAAVASDRAAVLGALVGTAMAVGVFAFGTMAVDLVSSVRPDASMMVALLTYVLQVATMGLLFVVLAGSGLLEDTLDRRWLGGVVMVCAFTWLTGQIWLHTRRRVPLYDTSGVALAPTVSTTNEGGPR